MIQRYQWQAKYGEKSWIIATGSVDNVCYVMRSECNNNGKKDEHQENVLNAELKRRRVR